jgi:hypothetical protein
MLAACILFLLIERHALTAGHVPSCQPIHQPWVLVCTTAYFRGGKIQVSSGLTSANVVKVCVRLLPPTTAICEDQHWPTLPALQHSACQACSTAPSTVGYSAIADGWY